MKQAKRFLALLLVLAMMLSNLPVAALADELNEPVVTETILEEPVETFAEEAAAAAAEEETQAPSEEVITTLEEETEAPSEEVTEAPTEEATEAPAEEATEAPVEETTEAPTEEATEPPAEEPTEDVTAEDLGIEVEDAQGAAYDDAYLSFVWLEYNEEEGFYETDRESREFRVMPGLEMCQIYYLNYKDENGENRRMPVHVQSNGDLNFDLIGEENAAPGQENGEYFYRVTTGTWDQELEVSCTVDGVEVGGVVAWTDISPLAAYTDSNMSKDTVITAAYHADVSDGAENALYIGMRMDGWSVESFFVDEDCSHWVYLEDIGEENMQRLRISEEGMRILREGGHFWVAVGAHVADGNNSWDEWANFSVGPDMSTAKPYLTFGTLDDRGNGWREPDWREYNGMHLTPIDRQYAIFYLNYWDEDQGGMVQKPVKVKGNKYITVGAVDGAIEDGQQNGSYFCKLTAKNWDKDTEVTYELDDGTVIRFGIWTGRGDIGLYSSADLSNDTYLGWEPMKTDFFGENSAYIGLDRDGFWLRDVTLPEEMAPYFDLERVNDNVFKITLNEAGLGRNLDRYHFGTQIFTEAENLENPERVENQEHWVTFSREHIESEVFFWVDGNAWELFTDGEKTVWGSKWNSGKRDNEGHEIWEGELTDDLPDGLYYDLEENVLTMDNFHGQYLGMAYEYHYDGQTFHDLPNANLTILLRGENRLVSDVDTALRFEGNMNVTFAGDGSLYVKSTNNVDHVDEEGIPYHYPTAYINNSDITFADSVNVTFEIEGEGLQPCWDEQGNYVGSEPAHLLAMHSDYATIILKDDATLTSVVPEGAKMGADEEHFDAVYRYGGFNNMSWKIQGGTLNTTTLGINSWWDNDQGKMNTNGYEQTGGTVNIQAQSYLGWNDEFQDEQGNVQSVAHTHYAGLTADTNCWINISGGELNINIDHDIEGGTPSVYYHGFELRDTLVNISGGHVRVESNIAGIGMSLQNDWENEEWGSKLEMTGGLLEFDMPFYGEGINLEPGGEVNLLGGTIEGRNTAFNMGGKVLLDGAEVNIWWGDFRADGEFTMVSGKLYLEYRSELVFNGPSEVKGGEIILDNSRIMHTGGAPLGLVGGSITINNAFNNAEEGVSYEAFVINGYCAVENDFELNINNDFVPVENYPWPHSILIARSGILHQMGGEITINQHNYTDKPDEVVQAVYVEEGCKLLINDGTFTVSCDGAVEGIHSREGSRIFVGAMDDGQKPVLTVNDAAMMIGGTLDLEWNAKVNANQSRVVIWDTGFLQLGDDPANTEANPVFTVHYSDVPENQQDEDYWSAAFELNKNATAIINDGTLTVNAEYCDNAIVVHGTYIQNGGEIHAVSVDPEWNATVGENCFCLGWEGNAEIHGGTMNLSGTDTGFSNSSRVGNSGRNSVYITGGTMNINVDRLGMWLEDKTTIDGGDFNITVNGHVSPMTNGQDGELLYQQGIMFYGWDDENRCNEPNTVLNINGGDFDINVKYVAGDYAGYNVKSLFVVNASANITDTAMRINGAPIVQVSNTAAHVLNISGVYSMNSGKLLVPQKYEIYYNENGIVDDPSLATGTEYWTIYEEDNAPGNIITDAGVDYANNLAIVSNKAGGNLTWKHENGVLTFEGEGMMDDFAAASAPWVVLSDFIRTAELEGNVNHVGANAFNGLKKLKTLSFLGDAPSFDAKAFAGVKADGFYPVENATWTKEVRQNYGGKITWAKDYAAAEVMSLTMDLEEPVLRANQKATLTATVSETTDPDMKVIWSLGEGDKSYVTLKAKGNTATVTAKAITERQEVTVYATTNTSRGEPQELKLVIIPRATKVEILRNEDDVVVSGTTQIIYMSSDAEENTLELYARNLSEDADEGWKWTSSTKYVTVEDGKVTALQPGKTATITATATDGSGKKATVTIKTYQPVEKIELAETEMEVGLNKSITLKATVFPANATNKKLKWEIVDNDGTATITSAGKLTGKKTGTVAVRVYADEDTDMAEICYVTVCAAVTKVNIYEGDNLVTGKTIPMFLDLDPVGENYLQLSAKNDPEDSAQNWIWSSSNTKYATVDNNGIVQAHQAGKTVTITATAADGSGKKATVKIKTVNPVDKVELPATAVAAKGKSITLTAKVGPNDATDKKLTWSLVGEYDKDYASISSSGKLTVKKNITEAHEITVRAAWSMDPDVYDECKVTLYPTVVTKVTIGYPEDAVYLSGTLSVPMDDSSIDLTAETAVEDAADEITWKSSNEKYATVDENGKVTILVANKVVTITATAADGSGKKATIKVKGVYPVADISLNTDDELFIAGGKSLKLANFVKILPENASNKKLTWTVSDNDYKITVNKSTGVLSTKKVTEPVTVTVTAEAQDGFGKKLSFEVVVYPATTKIILKDGEATVTGKTISKSVGSEFTLEPETTPELAAGVYTWKSSNSSYVSVDEDGNVTVLKTGKTITITCTAADGSGKTATVKVKGVAAE